MSQLLSVPEGASQGKERARQGGRQALRLNSHLGLNNDQEKRHLCGLYYMDGFDTVLK